MQYNLGSKRLIRVIYDCVNKLDTCTCIKLNLNPDACIKLSYL